MSEMLHSPTDRLEQLTLFCRLLIEGGNGKTLVQRYRPLIDTVTPTEAMLVLDQLLAGGMPLALVKQNTGKIINLFFRSLNAFEWERPAHGHFLHYLMMENREVEEVMADMKRTNKQLFGQGGDAAVHVARLKQLLGELQQYELHYVKKENILFPVLEQAFEQHRCLHVMWSFHDDFRRGLKLVGALLDAAVIDKPKLASALGDLFFVVLPLIFREERIVFPVALRAVPRQRWDDMLAQSHETGWCFGIAPPVGQTPPGPADTAGGLVDLGTGYLLPDQLRLMLDVLPVDVTLVDENDEVRYFSGGAHRIFPRSKAIIGRKVQNCHPPESVHIVNQIVAAFRDGTKEHADFWIEMKGRFVHIRYFALRDERGLYKGTIEVSQDVTDIRGLTGQRRLLDW